MNPKTANYSVDRTRFNPDHKHAFMFRVRRWNVFQLSDMRTAECYAHIVLRFEAGIEELKTVPHKAPVKRCQTCGKAQRETRLIDIWYYVMTGDDVLFERKCSVLTIERAVQRLESAMQRLRQLAAIERRHCKNCGTLKRRRNSKVAEVNKG